MAGTATTIDTLDADGNFLGGVIMPGVGLMLRSLAHGTAALPCAESEYAANPRCTDDAIVSGVIEAQAGRSGIFRPPGGSSALRWICRTTGHLDSTSSDAQSLEA
jgi:hypothetical protein